MELRLLTSQTTYRVYVCPDAWDGLAGSPLRPDEDGAKRVGVVGTAFRSHRSAAYSFFTRINKYAEIGKLHAPEQINTEGDGFFAIKHRDGLRAYCWLDGSHLIISHFIIKKRDGLAATDERQMKRNRETYQKRKQDNGIEYI